MKFQCSIRFPWMSPIRNISYLSPMCCSFWEKCINSQKNGQGCSTPLIWKIVNSGLYTEVLTIFSIGKRHFYYLNRVLYVFPNMPKGQGSVLTMYLIGSMIIIFNQQANSSHGIECINIIGNIMKDNIGFVIQSYNTIHAKVTLFIKSNINALALETYYRHSSVVYKPQIALKSFNTIKYTPHQITTSKKAHLSRKISPKTTTDK